MIRVSKSTKTTLKAKSVVIVDSSAFVDAETGDVISLLETLTELFGDEPFDLVASRSEEKDVAPTEE